MYYRNNPYGARHAAPQQRSVPRHIAEEIARERDLYRQELELARRQGEALRAELAQARQPAAPTDKARAAHHERDELLRQLEQAHAEQQRMNKKFEDVCEALREAREHQDEPAALEEAQPDEALTKQRDQAVQRSNELLEDMQRLRRRQQEDTQAQVRRQTRDLLGGVLEVRDNLARALKLSSGAESGWGEGMQQVLEQFDAMLEREGVRAFGAPGERFDPARHEAIGAVRSQDVPAGHIAHIEREGFMFEDETLLRPAQVVVSQ